MKQFIPRRFIAQNGKCAVTGVKLGPDEWHCHHKIPCYLTKDDSNGSLMISHKSIYLLIHLGDKEKIQMSLNMFKLNEKRFKEVNKFRKQCLNVAI